MSSAGYVQPLTIEPRPSRWFAGAVLVLHGGALPMILALPVDGWLAGVLLIALVFSLLRTLAGPVLMRRDSAIVAAAWLGDGRWRLRRRDGVEQEARLLPDSYVHPWLTVLNFRAARRCSLVLPWDSLDPETFRRLRVRLQLEGTATGSGAW